MKIIGNVEDIRVLFRTVRFKSGDADASVYIFRQDDALILRVMDLEAVTLISVAIPLSNSSMSVEEAPSSFVRAIPVKQILDPLQYFSDLDAVSLSFEEKVIVMKIANYERSINYLELEKFPSQPKLLEVGYQTATVEVDDLIRAINLTKDITNAVTFRLNKSGLMIDGDSIAVHSLYKVDPHQMTLDAVNGEVTSSYGTDYLLKALAFAKGQVKVHIGTNYPMRLSGTLKNGLKFVSFVAPRILEKETVRAEDGGAT